MYVNTELVEYAHAHKNNWPAKLTAPLAGCAKNDPKKRLRTCEIMPNLPLKKVTFYLATV